MKAAELRDQGADELGIKVWLYKGERLVPQRGREEEYRERAPRRPQGGPDMRR